MEVGLPYIYIYMEYMWQIKNRNHNDCGFQLSKNNFHLKKNYSLIRNPTSKRKPFRFRFSVRLKDF